MQDFQRIEIRSRGELRQWLQKHHQRPESIWLVSFKKAARPGLHVPYDDIVEEALCFGWVDSQPRSLDAERSMRLLSPRRAGSAWSALNKRRVEALIASGRMQPAGLAKVMAARADGSWTRIDGVEAGAIPQDLANALERVPAAQANFQAFPASTRRAILEWIGNARQPATRERRIVETVEKAKDNLRANQYRQPKGRGGAR